MWFIAVLISAVVEIWRYTNDLIFVGCIEWMNKVDKDWQIGTLSTGNLY
jgi:hypothetical protein